MLLGCIADDLTGATDLALMLTRAGMRTVQVMGVPEPKSDLDGFDAVVVALKSRTCPAGEAVACRSRRPTPCSTRGARQLFFKYCSTFDSTDQGNIGPVAEALLHRVDGEIALACPAFPANKRTVYLGNLFVGDVPLSESPMKDHPLTPMRDSNLVRVLQRQTRLPVGLVPFADVERGPAAIESGVRLGRRRRRALRRRRCHPRPAPGRHRQGRRRAQADHRRLRRRLGLPGNFIAQGLMETAAARNSRMKAPAGRQLILAGSCSEATRGQVKAAIAAGIPALEIDALAVAQGKVGAADLRWLGEEAAGERAGADLLQRRAGARRRDPEGVRPRVVGRDGREAAGRDREGALRRRLHSR